MNQAVVIVFWCMAINWRVVLVWHDATMAKPSLLCGVFIALGY
tara:strand:+ start:3178 stop:3306 length:129 start_codon:yes stop_codon:yes gene_type:complete